jgi:hypothetical protein
MPLLTMAQGIAVDQVGNWGLGLQWRNNGLGVSFQKMSASVNRVGVNRYYYADFVSHKHLKESKIVNHEVENKTPYVFGKLNHVGLARFGYGFSKALTERTRFNNFDIQWQSVIGPTLGIQRPTYVRVEVTNNDVLGYANVRYTPESVPDTDRIIGYSRNGDGWDELTYKPGVLFRTNVALNWHEYTRVSKQVNFGLAIDYFPDGLPIMAFTNNPKLYYTYFIGFMWVFETH